MQIKQYKIILTLLVLMLGIFFVSCTGVDKRYLNDPNNVQLNDKQELAFVEALTNIGAEDISPAYYDELAAIALENQVAVITGIQVSPIALTGAPTYMDVDATVGNSFSKTFDSSDATISMASLEANPPLFSGDTTEHIYLRFVDGATLYFRIKLTLTD